jgi:hypothetical protein
MTVFAHEFAEEVEVVFFELGTQENRWVSDQAYQLMFKENHILSRMYLGIILRKNCVIMVTN